MERNKWADDLANCIVRRPQVDTFLRPHTIVLACLVPFAIAYVLCAAFHQYRPDVFDTGQDMTIGLMAIVEVEASIASFILFAIIRRSHNHMRRDLEWMDALIGYVGSYGGDTARMSEIRAEASQGWWGFKTVASFGMLVLSAACIVFMGAWLFTHTDLTGFMYAALPTISYFALVAQFVITAGLTAGFPYRHDMLQTEFAIEVRSQCRGFGLDVPVMEPTVLTYRRMVHAILVVVTLGAYTLVLLPLACRNLNAHISTQWKYEMNLLVAIIRFEGGTGVEGIGSNQPDSALGKLIVNSM